MGHNINHKTIITTNNNNKKKTTELINGNGKVVVFLWKWRYKNGIEHRLLFITLNISNLCVRKGLYSVANIWTERIIRIHLLIHIFTYAPRTWISLAVTLYAAYPLWIKEKSMHAQLTILVLMGYPFISVWFLRPSKELCYCKW